MAMPINISKPGTTGAIVKRKAYDEPVTPPAILLLGDVGSGKTHSIITALHAGLEVFVIVTENTGVETLIDACEKTGADMSRLHWKRCVPTQQSWDVMKKQARITNSQGVGDIQSMTAGLDRHLYPAFLNLLDTCENFIDDRTKEPFGDIMTWGDDRLIVLDSLSGLNEIVSSHVTGHRITMTQPEYGVVQNHIYMLCNKIASVSCFSMITAHIEMETDEAKGTTKLMASTVGRKLAPRLMRIFSEVVYAKQENGKYIWSTQDNRVSTKHRALALGSMPADYKLLVDIYRKRKIEAEKENEVVT